MYFLCTRLHFKVERYLKSIIHPAFCVQTVSFSLYTDIDIYGFSGYSQ